MGLVYFANFSGVTISAAQDLFNIACGANRCINLHMFEISPDNVTAAAEVRVAIKRMTATVTNGSGGSAITFTKRDSNDAAATVTGRMNDTTRATTTGTTSVFWVSGMNLLNGWLWVPTPPILPTLVQNENLIIGLETAPASSTWSGSIAIEEGIF